MVQLTNLTPTSSYQVQNQLIWYNSNICVNNRPIFYKYMFNAGITFVKDLLNDRRESLSLYEMNQKYGISIDDIRYHSICQAIPKEWKKLLKG